MKKYTLALYNADGSTNREHYSDSIEPEELKALEDGSPRGIYFLSRVVIVIYAYDAVRVHLGGIYGLAHAHARTRGGR